jgi:predicted nicotinamide N-methyase
MPPLRMRYQTLEIGDLDIHLRTLRDHAQFEDLAGEAADLGISSAAWPLFGVLWSSGRVLGELMWGMDVAGRRTLEVGCGIGLASLVLSLQGEDISATDHHPEARRFLEANTRLNSGPAIPFFRTAWDDEDCGMGRFDLIVGSDLLYERGQAESLAGFIGSHALPTSEVIIVDPGRKQRGRFDSAMNALGFMGSREQPTTPYLTEPFGGQVLRFHR